MVSYRCERCHKMFDNKTKYTKHINRKFLCDKSLVVPTKIANISRDLTNRYQCNYCGKILSTNSNYNRHMSTYCKIKKQQDNEKEDLLQKLIKEKDKQNKVIKKQKLKMEEMMEIIKNIKNIENNIYVQNIDKTDNSKINNNIQINNNNIKLLAFGKEDMTHLAGEVYKKILNKGFKSIPTLAEQVHFDKNKPENHNVYISNMQNNYALIYDGNDWKLKERDSILQQLIDEKTDILSEKFDELFVKLDDTTIKKFQRFLDYKDEDKIVVGIKNDLKLLLYNNKKIPEKTREFINTSKGIIPSENKIITFL